MIRVEHEPGEIPWSVDVPDVGWMIEDGELLEMRGDDAFRRARDPRRGSCQVYWNREVAVEHFNLMYAEDEAVETPYRG